ncbi:MAG: hypothetical protein [Olavius algarvensis Gamma 3 endosymbiont]|nr:MAG: hypothetical protein [Olavius algarvensis Gamma 3 endosymbiont]
MRPVSGFQSRAAREAAKAGSVPRTLETTAGTGNSPLG